MKEKLASVIDQVIKRHTEKGTLGILVFGSVARGSFDEFSDIDVYVLQKTQPHYSREGYSAHGMMVDIISDGIKEARQLLREEKKSVRRNFSHMLAHGEIVYAAGSEIEKLQREAKENLLGKTFAPRAEVLMHLYSIEDFWGEVQRFEKRGDGIAFGRDCRTRQKIWGTREKIL